VFSVYFHFSECNEELHGLYSSNVIHVIKSRRMRWSVPAVFGLEEKSVQIFETKCEAKHHDLSKGI
jgi:hypothetical protein